MQSMPTWLAVSRRELPDHRATPERIPLSSTIGEMRAMRKRRWREERKSGKLRVVYEEQVLRGEFQ